jgi:hypothetical protein
VPDGVVDQVPDHPFEQQRVAGRLRRAKLPVDAQFQALDLGGGVVNRVLGPGGQVGELGTEPALIADGQGE